MLEECPLDTRRYDRAGFHSGVLALDDYLHQRADRRGEGLGRLLVACAVERCLAAKRQIAAYALLVDAKDEAAAAFYRHYGFTPCTGQPLTLYLPLGA